MSSEKEIREVRMMLSERLRNAAKAAMYGTVKSVDENARTCDVQIGGIVYEGVLLYSVEKENLRGRVLIPKRESAVIVARIDASDRLYVALFSEIDKVVFTLGGSGDHDLRWGTDRGLGPEDRPERRRAGRTDQHRAAHPQDQRPDRGLQHAYTHHSLGSGGRDRKRIGAEQSQARRGSRPGIEARQGPARGL